MRSAEGDALTRAEAERFLYREARLLDERRFEEWLDLFAAGGRLFVPGTPGEEDEVAIIDDDRATLADRVHLLRSPATYAQVPPSRTLRLVSNVEVRGLQVHSVQLIHEARLGQVRTVAARCRHDLVPADRDGGEPWRIASKVLHLVDCDHALGNLTFLL